jgi:hypothetical protein
MVENGIVGPHFRPFSTRVTVCLSEYRCTVIALILKTCLNAPDSALFQQLHRFCEILGDHLFHHLPDSRDPIWTIYATQKQLSFHDFSPPPPISLGDHCTSVTCILSLFYTKFNVDFFALKTEHLFLRRDVQTYTFYKHPNCHTTGVNALKY